MKWVTSKSSKTWLRNAWKVLKPATAEEAFKKKQVALKKIERDFADEAIPDQLWEVW